MTVGVSPTITPVFIELATHDIPRIGKEPGETTRIISIDAFSPTKPLADRKFTRIVNPEEPVSAIATERYGLTTEQTKKAQTFGKVWNEFRNWAEPEGQPTTVVLIAHRIYSFHRSVLSHECRRCERQFPTEWKAFDTAFLVNCLPEFRGWNEMALCEISDVINPQSIEVYKILDEMANGVPLERLYPLMLSAHPIKDVATEIKTGIRFTCSTTCLSSAVSTTAAKTNEVVLEAIFYDTETTGLLKKNKFAPGTNPRIVEFAAYKPRTNEYFTRLINPEISIPKSASDINNITDNMVTKAPKFDAVWKEFYAWAEAPVDGTVPKVIMIAYNNFGFDKKVMELETDRVGAALPNSWALPDPLYLARALKIPPPCKLQVLREKYGISLGEAHRAQDDVRVLYEVFIKLIGNTKEQRIYQEMATPGKEPIKRLARLIMEAGGPIPFEAMASTTSLAKLSSATTVTVTEPAAPVLVDDDATEIAVPPPTMSVLGKRKSTPAAAAQIKAPVLQKGRGAPTATQVDMASKIAAKMAFELAQLMCADAYASTSITAMVPMSAPVAAATTTSAPRRKLSPEQAERERSRLFFQRHYNGDINQVPLYARFQFMEFVNGVKTTDQGTADLGACALDDYQDLLAGADEGHGSLESFVVLDHNSPIQNGGSSEEEDSDDTSSDFSDPEKAKRAKKEEDSEATIPMSPPHTPKQ